MHNVRSTTHKVSMFSALEVLDDYCAIYSYLLTYLQVFWLHLWAILTFFVAQNTLFY